MKVYDARNLFIRKTILKRNTEMKASVYKASLEL